MVRRTTPQLRHETGTGYVRSTWNAWVGVSIASRSAEWFRRLEAEVARAVEAYKAAVIAADNATSSTSDDDGHAPRLVQPDLAQPSSPPERKGYMRVRPKRGPITAYSHPGLVRLVRWIESDTLLRTEEELVDEAIQLLGYRRHVQTS
jgi:hypothetical protein